jgi:competence protein ComEA
MAVLFAALARDTDATRDPRSRLATLHATRDPHPDREAVHSTGPAATRPAPADPSGPAEPAPPASTASPPPPPTEDRSQRGCGPPSRLVSGPLSGPLSGQPDAAHDDGDTAFAAYLDGLHLHGNDPLGIAALDCWPHPDRHHPSLSADGTRSPSPATPAEPAVPPARSPSAPTTSDPSPAAPVGGPAADDVRRRAGRPSWLATTAGRGTGRLVRRWLPDDLAADGRAGRRPWVSRLEVGRRQVMALAAVVLLAAVVALSLVWRSRPVAEAAPRLAPVAHETSATDTVDLVVSIAGPVVTPGLVRLRPGARVADALAAAGGPLPGTDLTGVNLARRLTDGEHVVIGPGAALPAGGTAPEGRAAGGAPHLVGPSGSGARLDLNTATLAELDTLPGIGPVTAQRILDWRAEHGRFASVDQLREIDGIGETRFARLRDLVLA